MNKRWMKRIAIAAASVGVVGGIGVVAAGAGLASVSEIRVEGAQRVNPRDVLQASGLEVGSNALTLDLDAAASKVEEVPLVESALVRREGALGVVIEVTERQPQLRIKHGAQISVVDSHAEFVTGDPAGHLPLLEVDRDAGLTPAVVAAALKVSGKLRAPESKKAALTFGPVRGLVLRVGNRVVIFGDPHRINLKLKAWRNVVTVLGRNPIRLDVSEAPRIAISR